MSTRQATSRQRVAQHQVLTDQAAGVGKAEQPSHPWIAYGTTVKLAMNTDYTLKEVGKQFDATRERIQQIDSNFEYCGQLQTLHAYNVVDSPGHRALDCRTRPDRPHPGVHNPDDQEVEPQLAADR